MLDRIAGSTLVKVVTPQLSSGPLGSSNQIQGGIHENFLCLHYCVGDLL